MTPPPNTPALQRLRLHPRAACWLQAPPPAPPQAPAESPPAAPPWVVVVHGLSRNAGSLARAFAPLAWQAGAVLLAPHFGRRSFPDYQRLGRPGHLGAGGRADEALHQMLDAAQQHLGQAVGPLLLFGHSGGAQFVQRYALLHPGRVARYALSAPGSLAWPTSGKRFPLGWAPHRTDPSRRPDADTLLRRPGLLLVGEADEQRSASLRQGPRIDAEQGPTRRARAEHYAALLAAQAQARGLPPPLRLELLPGIGHSFRQALAQGELLPRVARHWWPGMGWEVAARAGPRPACEPSRALQPATAP